MLAQSLRRWGVTGKIAVTALSLRDENLFEAAVADGTVDIVLQPFDDAADDAIETIFGPEQHH